MVMRTDYLSYALLLVGISLGGILLHRRQAIRVFICLELLLLSINLGYLMIGVETDERTRAMMALFVLGVARVETSLGLCGLLAYARAQLPSANASALAVPVGPAVGPRGMASLVGGQVIKCLTRPIESSGPRNDLTKKAFFAFFAKEGPRGFTKKNQNSVPWRVWLRPKAQGPRREKEVGLGRNRLTVSS